MELSGLSLRARLVISIVGILLISMVTLSVFTILDARSSAIESAVSHLSQKTEGKAAEVASIINNAFAINSEYQGMMESAIASKTANRQYLNMRLERSLKENKNFFGTWVVMEPNMLDGRDSMMRPGNGNDKNGVFTPYFVRDDGKIIQDTDDPEYDVREEYAEDYYKLAHDSQNYVLTEPYTEELSDSDKKIVMTSTAAPVISDGEVVGVTGIDFELSEIQAALSAFTPYDNGYAVLVSAENMITAHPDNALLGQSVNDAGYSEEVKSFFVADGVGDGLFEVDGRSFHIFREPVSFSRGTSIWRLIVLAPEEGILEQVSETTLRMAMTGVVLVLIALGLSWLIANRQVRPIISMSISMKEIADGNLDSNIPDHDADTELGQMATALAEFKQKAQENRKLQEDAERMRLQSEEQRKQAMQEAADRFEEEVQASLHTAKDEVRDITDSTENVQSASNRTLENSTEASRETDQVSMNVSTVSASVEELTASIREISSQTQISQSEASSAALQARETHQRMANLVGAVEKINEIGNLIQDIAEQTNLLALNATIEAARAGEAGKGFAVVASEVKNLANQTAQATEQISQEVADVQAQTSATARDIENITKMVERFSELSTAVAAAVEEQSAATSEISQAVAEAATGTDRLRDVVNNSRASAEDSGVAARSASDVVASLAREFDNLTEVARKFVVNIRSS